MAEQALSSCALSYFIPVLPMSILRWYNFPHDARRLSSGIAFTITTIFSLSGALDVMVFLLTRQGLLLFEKGLSSDESIAVIPDPMESQQVMLEHISVPVAEPKGHGNLL